MKISVQSMNSSSSERELHRMDTDMSTKSVLGVFAVILIGLVFTFWEFVSAVPISAGLMWTLVVVGILVALLIGFFVAAAVSYTHLDVYKRQVQHIAQNLL